MTTAASAPPVHDRARARSIGPTAIALVLLVVALAAAVSVDVVRTGFGIKGDEATYVTMALSLAYDRDLSFERRDIERFWGLYRGGPEGIFLKRGKTLRVRIRATPPFLRVTKLPDPRTDRLYFGKALVYPLAAAPFVWLVGLNGFLVFHVLLLFGVCACGYAFLVARSRPAAALTFTLAFVGATAVPIYAVFFTSDLFNFAIVFYALFLWLYKEVAAEDAPSLLRGAATDVVAAVLLGVATYSKPTNALLIAPIVLLFWWRRRFARGLIVGLVFVVATAGLFGINAWNSGEFNYQGGDRRTFYTRFPFETSGTTWDRGIVMTTNDSDAESVLAPSELANRFGHNVEYFLIGRHFGLVPYFFPGVVAFGLWLLSGDRFAPWRVLTLVGVVASTVALLLFLPYSWSGGGGPTGNRYFVSLYPALFFLVPSVSIGPALLAWLGGALFTAKLLVNPFVAAKFPYLVTEHGFARRLPVELTMANDLPVMLDRTRSRIPYGTDPPVLLYFLDENAYPPDPAGIWISGSGRTDILVRSEQPIHTFHIRVASPIRTVFTVSAGAAATTVSLQPMTPVFVDVPAVGVRGFNSYAYLLSARSTQAFTPVVLDPSSTDARNLSAIIQFTAR